jgi:hypothetical protein
MRVYCMYVYICVCACMRVCVCVRMCVYLVGARAGRGREATAHLRHLSADHPGDVL